MKKCQLKLSVSYLFQCHFLRIEEGGFMSVRSNVERRVSEEMSTEVERKLYFSLPFSPARNQNNINIILDHCSSFNEIRSWLMPL